MADTVGLHNETNKETMVRWMVGSADILPTRAAEYADLIIDAGIGSMARVSKKLAKKESFLTDIGVDDDDSEEIVAALLREKNAERQESMKSVPSRRLSLNTRSISYQSPMNSPGSSTKSLSPQKLSLGARKSMNFSSSSSSVDRPSRGMVSSTSSPNVLIDRPKSLSSGEFASLLAQDDGNFTGRQKAKRMLSNIDEDDGNDADDSGPAPLSSRTTTVIPVSSAVLRSEKSASSKESSASEQRSTEETVPKRKSMLGHLAQLSRDKAGGISLLGGSGSHPANPSPSKDMVEVQELCGSIAGDLHAAVEYRNETATIAALSRVYETSVDDMGYFVHRLGEVGACKSISSLLATFTHSVEASLCAAKAISLLCQYSDTRDSLNTENMEIFGGHGSCSSLLRVLSTHGANGELVELTCHAIAKLSNTEKNIASFTKAGTCEKMLGILTDSHSTVRTCNEAAFVVRALAQRDATVTRIIECGLCEGLVNCLSAHSYDEIASRDMIRAMLMIGHVHAGCLRLGEAGACQAVVESMKKNEASVGLAEWALMALEMLLKSEENFSRLLQASVCEVLVNCLNRNMQVANIARGACRAVQLLAANDMIRSKLGSDGACEVFPRALSNHIGSSSIAQVSCGAIGALACDHTENKAKLTAAGACDYIILTIEKYSATDNFRKSVPAGFETIVWQACWALRKLGHGGANRSRMESSNACEALHNAALRHVGTIDVVVQVFRAINVLTSNKTHPIVLRMGNAGVCKSVVRAILKNDDSEVICKLGSEVICHLADRSENIEKLIAAKGFDALSGALTKHASSNEGLTQWACRAIHMLCASGEHAQNKARTSGGVDAIVWALQRQGKHQEVAEWGIVAMKELSSLPANRGRLGTAGGCETVINVAKRHSHIPAITHRSCTIMHFLAQEANNRAWLGASGGCDVVVRAYMEHGNIAIVCAAANLAVASLALHHEGNNNRLRAQGTCANVLGSMRKHMASSHVCDHGCNAVYRLGEFSECIEYLDNADACAVVIESMKTHPSDKGVALHGLQSLTVLSDPMHVELYPKLIDSGVNSAVLTLLKDPALTEDIEVCSEGCKVISNLGTHPENRLSLGEGEACKVVAGILKHHQRSSPEVVLQATLACIQLATNCDENVQKLTDHGVCEALIESIEHGSEHLIQSICECLVCLSRCSGAKAILSEANNCHTIVRLLAKTKTSTAVASSLMRVITALCFDCASCCRFGTVGACKVVTSSILNYKDNKACVESGVSTLFQLCEVADAICDENISRLCTSEAFDALSTALKLYGDSVGVADPVLRIIVHITHAPGGCQEAQVTSPQKESSIPAPHSQAHAMTPPKASRWSILKKTLLGERGERSSIAHTPLSPRLTPSLSTQRSIDDLHTVRSKLGDAGICEGVVRAMFSHNEVESTAMYACEVVRNLCVEPSNVDLIARAGGCEVLASVFKHYATRSERLVINSCYAIRAFIKLKKTNSSIFSGLGTCEILSMAMLFYSSSPDTIVAVCETVRDLASSHKPTEVIFADADACRALMNILAAHHEDIVVCGAAASALHSIVEDNGDIISKLASIKPLDDLVKVLRACQTNAPVVQHVLWILSTLCPCYISTDKDTVLFASLLVDDIRGLIVSCFLAHASSSREVCREGCNLFTAIMDPLAHRKTFLFKDRDIEMCIYFGGAGVCDVLAKALNTYFSHESVVSACLRTLSLLTRVLNDHYAHDRQRRSSRVTKAHNNVDTLVGFSTHDDIIKILHKYHTSITVSCYGIFTLSNMLVNQPVVLESISSSLKSLTRNMNTTLSDSVGARFNCIFIYQLAACGPVYREKLVVVGAGLVIGETLRKHVSSPHTMRDACVAVAKIAHGHDLGKERLVAAGVCASLPAVISAYSLNEEIVVEACIATSVLMKQSPNTCSKFSSTEIDSLILGLLQSFGFGEGECAPIFATMTCHVVGDFSASEAANDRPTSSYSRKGLSSSNFPSSPPHERADKFGRLGVCESLLLVLEKYPSHEEVVEAACFAITKLTISPENVARLNAAGAAGVIAQVREKFANNSMLVVATRDISTALGESIEEEEDI